MIEQHHFKHLNENDTYIRPADLPEVDATLDWLIESNASGYKMVNSVQRLKDMREFMRGKVRAMELPRRTELLIVRVDGTLAPCFPMYYATYDWGASKSHKFEITQLNEMKKSCQPHCFSTLNHNLAYCYSATRVLKWVGKQAKHGFQGVTGSFD